MKTTSLEKYFKKFMKSSIDIAFVEEHKDELTTQLTERIHEISDNYSKDTTYQDPNLIGSMFLASYLGVRNYESLSIIPFDCPQIFNDEGIKKFNNLYFFIFPYMLYQLDDFSYGHLIALLSAEINDEIAYLIKAPLLFKLFRECYFNNELEVFYDFIDENIDKKLYESFVEDVITAISLADKAKAAEYLDKFYTIGNYDASVSHQYYEWKLMTLDGPYSEDTLAIISEEFPAGYVLKKLETYYGFKVLNSPKGFFDDKIAKDREIYVDHEVRLKKSIKPIFDKVNKTKLSSYDPKVFVKDLFNLDVSYFAGIDTNDYFYEANRKILIGCFVQRELEFRAPNLKLKDLAVETVNQALDCFASLIETKQMSISDYDKSNPLFCSTAIDEIAFSINRFCFIKGLNIPVKSEDKLKLN